MKTFTIENETNNIIAHAIKREAEAVPNADRFTSAAELAELAANWTAPRLVEIWNSIPGNTPVKKFTDRKTAATRIWKAIQSLGDATTDEAALGADVKTAATRIWKAIQSLGDATTDEAALGADVPASEAAEEATPPERTPEIAPDPHHAPTAENVEVEADAAPSEPAGNVSEQAPDVAPELAKATKKATREKKTPTGEPKPKSTREGSKTETVLTLMKREGGVTLKGIMETTGWQAHSVRGFISGTIGKKMGLTVVSTKAESGERTYTLAS